MSSTRNCRKTGWSSAEHALGDIHRDEAVLGIELIEPEAEDTNHFERPWPGEHPERRHGPVRADQLDAVADLHLQHLG
jgi:hypothetical protein